MCNVLLLMNTYIAYKIFAYTYLWNLNTPVCLQLLIRAN